MSRPAVVLLSLPLAETRPRLNRTRVADGIEASRKKKSDASSTPKWTPIAKTPPRRAGSLVSEMSSLGEFEHDVTEATAGQHLSLVPALSEPKSSADESCDETIQGKLGFQELLLIHRSLEAVRTLGLVERQDTLLNDTIQLVEVVLREVLIGEQAQGSYGNRRGESFRWGPNPARSARRLAV